MISELGLEGWIVWKAETALITEVLQRNKRALHIWVTGINNPLFTILQSPNFYKLWVFPNSFGIYPSILIWFDFRSGEPYLNWHEMNKFILLQVYWCVSLYDITQDVSNLKLDAELLFLRSEKFCILRHVCAY